MKKISLAGWILIGLVAGAATGFLVEPGIEIIKPIGTLFLRLLKTTIYPLIFFSTVFSLFLGVCISLMGNSKPGQMIADFMQAGADVMSAMVKNQPRGCRFQCR